MKKLLWDVNQFTTHSTIYDTDGISLQLFGRDTATQLASLANYISLLDDDVQILVNRKGYAKLTMPLAQVLNTKYSNQHKIEIIEED